MFWINYFEMKIFYINVLNPKFIKIIFFFIKMKIGKRYGFEKQDLKSSKNPRVNVVGLFDLLP